MSLCLHSATELAAQLRSQSLSAVELLDVYAAQVESLNPALNAVVTLDLATARARAQHLDALAAKGEWQGPLHGLPFTIKDTFASTGLRTTAGASVLSDHIPTENAESLQLLLDAGAVLLGKTNTPAFAADLQTHNKVFGTTNNPWNLKHTCGGSSGGSAVAAAAALAAFDGGSDIAGSLRTPAHFCGVYTIKPSYGLLSSKGVISGLNPGLLTRDISCVGPLTRSAADLRLLLTVLQRPSTDRSHDWRAVLPAVEKKSLQDYRVGLWLDDSFCRIDHQLGDVYSTLVDRLSNLGVPIKTAKPDFSLAEATDIYMRLLATASAADLDHKALIKRQRSAQAMSPELKQRMAYKGIDYMFLSAHELSQALEARAQLQAKWKAFFRNYDVLLCPPNPITAIEHLLKPPHFFQDITINGEPREYADMWTWVGALAGVAHLPAAVAPLGLAANGLPVGVQIIGPYMHDYRCIDFAEKLADVMGGYQPAPMIREVGK